MSDKEYKKKRLETKRFLRNNLSAFQSMAGDKFGYLQKHEKSPRLLWHLTSFKPIDLKNFSKDLGDGTWYVYQKCTYKKSDLDILNPDKIDNRLFWVSLNGRFKYAPVCGATSDCEKDLNFKNLTLFHNLVLKYKDIFQGSNIMEIGYGFGSFPYYCENYSDTVKINNYYGLDYLNRIEQLKYPKKYRFYETNGYKIPGTIPDNLDVVFSSNVFQHLSLKQKLNYLTLSYDKLKDGGYFIFNSILRNEQLLNDIPEIWGKFDEKGIPYLQMFDQYIEVDDTEHLKSEILKIGYEIIEFTNIIGNLFDIVLKK